MTRGELLKIIEQNGKDYYKDAPQSILRNKHMNNLKGNEQIDKNIVEAVIVDFIKDSCNLDLVKTKLNYEKG